MLLSQLQGWVTDEEETKSHQGISGGPSVALISDWRWLLANETAVFDLYISREAQPLGVYVVGFFNVNLG